MEIFKTMVGTDAAGPCARFRSMYDHGNGLDLCVILARATMKKAKFQIGPEEDDDDEWLRSGCRATPDYNWPPRPMLVVGLTERSDLRMTR
jgi:hypothetical protein